jgi:hypothetical protein
MKAKIIPISALAALFSLLVSSCEDSTYKEYQGYKPVYLSYSDLRTAVKETENTDLKNPGKIYFKDDFIFIVEELSGIHVYDNTNPSSPVHKTFVKLPGVVDISVSGSTLYADSYVDLVVLDVMDIENIHEVGRVKDVFPYTVPAFKKDFPSTAVDKEKGVVVDWELGIIKERVVHNPVPYPVYYDYRGIHFMEMTNSSGASSGISGSGIGVGGSMARFGIKAKTLYAINQNALQVFDITNGISPVKVNELFPGWNVETLFLTENQMYLGTTTGMAIYDISLPASPVSKTFFTHARSCDPVIVDDTVAYITLRTGTNCGGIQNVLDIVSIKDITKPVMLFSYFMTNPHGLGKDGDLLFICDGFDGLKIFNAADPKVLLGNLIYRYPDIKAFDVIPVDGVLVLISEEGLYQYDYSDVKNISLLSSIPVVK